MNKVLIASFVVGMSLMSVQATASSNVYVQANIGSGQLSTKSENGKLKDSGVMTSLMAGKSFGEVRAAIDVGTLGKIHHTDYHNETALNVKLTGHDTTKIKGHTLGMNAFYDFKNASKFTPYAGVRLSVNRLQIENHEVETFTYLSGAVDKQEAQVKLNKNRVGYGVNAGVQYHVNSQLIIDTNIALNRIDGVKARVSDGEVIDFNAKQVGVTMGVRYQF